MIPIPFPLTTQYGCISLAFATLTLPAGADHHRGVDPMGRVQRPVVDDLRPLAVSGAVQLSVHKQFYVREAHVDRVVMPFVVAHLW